MSRDEKMVPHAFAPGEGPTIYTADICAEIGHEHCKGLNLDVEGDEGKTVFCICLCHRVFEGEPN
jgi:hypothetical protein